MAFKSTRQSHYRRCYICPKQTHVVYRGLPYCALHAHYFLQTDLFSDGLDNS